MMSYDEIFAVATDTDLAEVGGAHNQKGINFQRVWAVARMVELDQNGHDFLMLFEAIQDVAEFDSENAPTTVRVYQVKKKDTGTWGWKDLTCLYEINSKKFRAQNLDDVKGSALGKLYGTVRAFKQVKSSGHFVSNTGCDLKLAGGDSASGFATRSLDALEVKHRDALTAALATFHGPNEPSPDLSRLHVMTVPIHPGAPEQALTGIAFDFLKSRSPQHANQAEALIQTLLLAVGSRSAKTDKCRSFVELRQQRGFSRGQFQTVLATLETIPDVKNIVCGWLDRWPDGSLSLRTIGRVKVEVSRIYQMRLGRVSDEDQKVVSICDTWISEYAGNEDVPDQLQLAKAELVSALAGFPQERFIAHFLMRAAERCVDQTSGS